MALTSSGDGFIVTITSLGLKEGFRPSMHSADRWQCLLLNVGKLSRLSK